MKDILIDSEASLSSSLLFSCSVVSISLRLHGPQHTRLPCPSPSPRACSDSCPLSQGYDPTISSSVGPFFFYFQSFPASGPSYLVAKALEASLAKLKGIKRLKLKERKRDAIFGVSVLLGTTLLSFCDGDERGAP